MLVVDDNATNRHILAEWLRGWQMDPTAVGDGMAAMDALWHRAANGRPYALVLLDARMPDADGLAVAAMIRERAELAATRIILLTSGERPGDPARIRELRIDAQLLKPVQQDELLETIYRVMSRSQGNAPPLAWPAPRQQARTAPVPAATPLHILVAEDNELARKSWSSHSSGRDIASGWRATAGRCLRWRNKGVLTCCSWTFTCRSWTASRSSRRFGSGS